MSDTTQSSSSGGHPVKFDFELHAVDVLTIHGHREAVGDNGNLQMMLAYPWSDSVPHDAKRREATIIAVRKPAKPGDPPPDGWPAKQPTWDFEVPDNWPSSSLYDGASTINWTAHGTNPEDAKAYDIKAEAGGLKRHITVELFPMKTKATDLNSEHISPGILDLNTKFFGHYTITAKSGQEGTVIVATERQELYNTPLLSDGFFYNGQTTFFSNTNFDVKSTNIGKTWVKWITGLVGLDMKTSGSVGWKLDMVRYSVSVDPKGTPGPWSGALSANAEASIAFGGTKEIINRTPVGKNVAAVEIRGDLKFAVKGFFSYDFQKKSAHLQLKLPEVTGSLSLYTKSKKGTQQQLGSGLSADEIKGIKIPGFGEAIDFDQEITFAPPAAE